MKPVLAAIAFSVVAACDGGTAAPSPSAASAGTHSSAHFTFHFTALDAASIGSIAGSVEAEYARILADLGVSGMPLVDVTFHADHAALAAAVGPHRRARSPPLRVGWSPRQPNPHDVAGRAGWGAPRAVLKPGPRVRALRVATRRTRQSPTTRGGCGRAVALYEAGQLVDLAGSAT